MEDNSDDAMIRRIEELMHALGLNPTSASMAAVGKPDLVRDIRRKGSVSGDRLERLAAVLETSVHWLRTGEAIQLAPKGEPLPSSEDFQHYRNAKDEPPKVPVLGSALAADITVDEGGNLLAVETIFIFPNDVVDYLRRPFRLIDRPSVYAFYFEGDSMEPKYTAGEPAFVDPKRPPGIGDYVLIQLRRAEGDDETIHCVLAKRLVKRSASFVELEQFNPPMRFRIPREQIAHMHKILQNSEIYSI